MLGLKKAEEVRQEPDKFELEQKAARGYMLYNRELRKGVELGRKLGRLQRNVAHARAYATDVCSRAIVGQGLSPNCTTVLAFRNMVRAMKGKNLL